MDITIEAFNALPQNEQVVHLLHAGKLIRSDYHECLYSLSTFRVRMLMEWNPIRITEVTAFELRAEEG